MSLPQHSSGFAFGPFVSRSQTGVVARPLVRASSNPDFAAATRGSERRCSTPLQRSTSYLRIMPKKNTVEVMRVLVLGAPQVGKSALVNSYRAAVTNNLSWPAAPVGICGFCGTTTVEPFPNHPTEPTWLCIDTPGKFYDAGDEGLLRRLFTGVPWKTRLAGKDALRPEELENLSTVSENSAHQCILVIPATDIVEDNGRMSLFFFKPRYDLAPDAEGVVMYLTTLISSARFFLHDASPFLVITKMDLVGGAGNMAARRLITSLLSRCIPLNRLYFCASPADQSSYETKSIFVLDPETRKSLIQLHRDLFLTFRWRMAIKNGA